mmetsp:Transcript_59038/g.139473  ORF Transcript_59038/g.139473 Transcript_59038/m.139473 type:complete len:294 (-) Transcript_59038:125-1006(-)
MMRVQCVAATTLAGRRSPVMRDISPSDSPSSFVPTSSPKWSSSSKWSRPSSQGPPSSECTPASPTFRSRMETTPECTISIESPPAPWRKMTSPSTKFAMRLFSDRFDSSDWVRHLKMRVLRSRRRISSASKSFSAVSAILCVCEVATVVAKWRASWSANSSVCSFGTCTLKAPWFFSSSIAHWTAVSMFSPIVASSHSHITITASPANLMTSPPQRSTCEMITVKSELMVEVSWSIPSCPRPWKRSESLVNPEISTMRRTACFSATSISCVCKSMSIWSAAWAATVVGTNRAK